MQTCLNGNKNNLNGELRSPSLSFYSLFPLNRRRQINKQIKSCSLGNSTRKELLNVDIYLHQVGHKWRIKSAPCCVFFLFLKRPRKYIQTRQRESESRRAIRSNRNNCWTRAASDIWNQALIMSDRSSCLEQQMRSVFSYVFGL